MQVKVWRTYTNKVLIELGEDRFIITPPSENSTSREMADEVARNVYSLLCWLFQVPQSLLATFQDDRIVGIINAPEEGSDTGAGS